MTKTFLPRASYEYICSLLNTNPQIIEVIQILARYDLAAFKQGYEKGKKASLSEYIYCPLCEQKIKVENEKIRKTKTSDKKRERKRES